VNRDVLRLKLAGDKIELCTIKTLTSKELVVEEKKSDKTSTISVCRPKLSLP